MEGLGNGGVVATSAACLRPKGPWGRMCRIGKPFGVEQCRPDAMGVSHAVAAFENLLGMPPLSRQTVVPPSGVGDGGRCVWRALPLAVFSTGEIFDSAPFPQRRVQTRLLELAVFPLLLVRGPLFTPPLRPTGGRVKANLSSVVTDCGG